jgi:hypothetical protein
MNHPLPVLTLLGSCALALAMPACNPSVYIVSDDAGAAPSDARSDVAVADPATCVPCVNAPDKPGPGCDTEYAACEADATCNGLWQCVLASGCIGGPPASFISCALPCANEAGGIPSAAAGLFECLANGACSSVCVTK